MRLSNMAVASARAAAPVPGEQDGPGRAAAQPMERRAAVAVAPADEIKQGVLQEEAAREDRQAGRLGQDEDVVVLEQGREIRRSVGLLPGKAMIEERVAAAQEIVGAAGRPFRRTSPASILSRHSASVEWG